MASSSAAFNIIFGAKTDNLEKALKTVDGRLRRSAASFNQVGRTLTTSLTAPLAAIGASSFQAAANFEQEMAKVRAVSGATSQEFTALSDNARQLGASTRYSASEVAGLQVEFAKLGFTASEITNVTGATLALAQASGSDLARSAEVAGSTLRSFGLETTETGRVTDVMAASFSSSALDLESFAEAVKYVAPVAKSAGLSIEETSGYLAVLANNGIKGSQAGTSLRRIISELAGTGQDLGEVLNSTAGATLTLADAKDEVGRSAQSAYLILREGMGDVERLTTEFQNSQGAAAAMAKVMDETALGGIARMRSAIEGAQITIGEALAPTILDLVKTVENLATSFGRLPRSTQENIVKFGALAAAIGPLSLATGKMIGAFRALVPTLRKISTIARANPWTIYAAAILGAITLIVKLTDKVDAASVKQEQLTEASKRAGDQYGREAGKINALLTQYKYAGDDLDRRKSIIGELQKIAPNYFGNLDAEKTSYDRLAGAVGNYNERLRQQAIAKAFGEQLTDVEAERLRVAEELFQAEIKLAQATEALATANEKSGGSIKDGTNLSLDAQTAYDGALRTVTDLKAEQEGLAAASDELAAAIERASSSMQNLDQVGGAVSVGDLLSDLEGMEGVQVKVAATIKTDTGADPVVPEVVVPISYDLPGSEDLDRIMTALSTDLGEAAGRLTLGEDQIVNLESIADAYRQAAIAAAGIGQLDLATELYDQATAYQAQADAIDRTAASIEEVKANLTEALNQAEAAQFVSGDEVANLQALASAYGEAAAQAYLLGQTDLAATFRDQAQAAREAADALQKKGETTETTTAQSNDLANSVESVANSIAQSFTAGIQSAAKGEEDLATILAGIGRNILGTLLAETIGFAIRNAFQSASAAGPAAAIVGPGLAATGVSAVEGLFNDIPFLAEGGLTTGPTLAMIGDNPGGREAVIPLNRLERMMSSQAQEVAVSVSGRLRGDDILVSSQRSRRRARRLNRLQ